jgi:O-antigen/teichoic acid export membrane protein
MSASNETASFSSKSTNGTESKESEGVKRGRTISKGVSSLTVQNIGTSILALVFVSALLRYLPGAQYGVYSAVSIIVSISAAFATFGLQYASARYLSILGTKRGQIEAIRKIFFLSLFFSTIVTVSLVALSPSISLFFTKSTSWVLDFDLGAFWLFSSSIALIFQGVVQGIKRYTLLAKMLFVSRIVMVALTIIGLYENANVSVAIYAWIVYGALISSWALIVIRRDLASAVLDNDTQNEKEKEWERQHPTQGARYGDILRYSSPLGIAGILTVATQNSDLVVVGGYLNPISLGIYNAVITISSFLTFVLLTPLVTAILPEASSSLNDPRQLSNGLRLAFRFIILGVLPASLFVAAASPQLLLIFSGQSSYLQGSISLELIAAFYSLLAIQTVIYSVLQALGRTFHVLLITLATTSAEIGGSLLLVPQVGLLGAAVGRVIAATAGMIVSIYLAKELLAKKKENQNGFYWKGIFSAVLPFLVILFLSSFLSHSVWTLVPYSIVAMVLFLFCTRSLKVLNNEDRVLLANILPGRLRKLLAYV